jgi:hypothetical protein
MGEHLFITTRHFENCHKYQIFGVGKASINQFGLVNKGDKVFFLNKDENLIIGPYEVISDVFYDTEVIWEEKNGIDKYPYRVRLKSDTIYAIDINIFSQIVEENGIRIDSGDLGQKSVFTFLPKDCGIIEPLLRQKGNKIEKDIEEKEFQENKITIELAQNRGFTEAFLEFFLLKQFNEQFKDFFPNTSVIPYNQFRINLLGSKIDIISISERLILVIEVKKDSIKKEDIEQLRTYFSWTKNCRKLLGNFFGKELDDTDIKGLIIGSGIQRGLSIDDCSFSLKKYSLERGKLKLSDILKK